MGMKANEVGNWLRQIASKRDHHEVLSGDYLVLRPGPNFDLLMGNLAAGQITRQHRSLSKTRPATTAAKTRAALSDFSA